MRVSIREVATRAGVSRATVSKVLSGGRDTISHATQERVRIAADELGYRPNAIARSLRRRRTDVIGYYSGYPTAFWQIESIQRACEKYQKDLLIHGAFRHGSPEAILSELEDGKIDGLIVVAPNDDRLVRQLVSSSLPVVAFADAAAGIPSVVLDDVHGGRLMAEYLAAKGHRRVIFRPDNEKRESARRRMRGFIERSKELNLTGHIAVPVDFPGHLSDEELACLQGRSERYTAFACWTDDFQLPILHTAMKLGWRVPDDVATIGVGDSEFDLVTRRRLTHVLAPWPKLAEQAVSVLMQQIAGEEVPEETVLPVTLQEGDTA